MGKQLPIEKEVSISRIHCSVLPLFSFFHVVMFRSLFFRVDSLLPLLLFAMLPLSVCAQPSEGERYRIAFWNVENFFDTYRDTLKDDAEYTPDGGKHWNSKRYATKRQQLYKTIVAMAEGTDETDETDETCMPVVVGLAEVENGRVLRDLCQGTPLRRYDYRYIHYDSPDVRGSDVALLYRPARFNVLHHRALPLSDTAAGFYTRDLLEVMGNTCKGDTLILYVCHFPSKRGGAEAEGRRHVVAKRLRSLMDSAAVLYPTAIVVAMGDFNATMEEPCLTQSLGIEPHADSADRQPFVNLMATSPRHEGTYNYQGTWSYIDHFFVSSKAVAPAQPGMLRVVGGKAQVCRNSFLLMENPRRLDSKPRPTYQGPKYVGGASDHLPIFFTLSR